MENLSVSK